MANGAPPATLVIGVLGGMGPQATADFLAKLTAATPAECEQDHLRVHIDSNPKVPDRSTALTRGGESPGPVLAAMAAGLERAGADFLVMPCNTAHAYEAEIRAAVGVPFVSMIDETCAACELTFPDAQRFGLLATSGCVEARLYQSAFARAGRATIVLAPADQERLTALLYRIKLGDRSHTVHDAMRAFGETLIDAGADAVVAACSEVPLVLGDGELSRPLLDATLQLARRCVRYAYGCEPLPAVCLSAT
ncbi:aspartate/glutamate racemase family protein [Paraburkholderia solisilvae]|uniref:Aspartate racemase n=1 Tax=Paraburkholderia solisilvae TaxID=624376 RepID=A0A6J5D7W2_9BURK|nr:amino acid racemase [Paraburkholderia solisilvae]CAB3750348.1 Aspartate racemase [Paraburkholderia solisilvae]